MLLSEISVLIVDDSLAARRLHRKTLELLGFKLIDEADDGDQGVAKIEAAVARGQCYNIVLCDISMPHMNGYDFMKVCQRLTGADAIKFVVITAFAAQTDICNAIGAGAVDFIIKPVSVEQMQAVVTRIANGLLKS